MGPKHTVKCLFFWHALESYSAPFWTKQAEHAVRATILKFYFTSRRSHFVYWSGMLPSSGDWNKRLVTKAKSITVMNMLGYRLITDNDKTNISPDITMNWDDASGFPFSLYYKIQEGLDSLLPSTLPPTSSLIQVPQWISILGQEKTGLQHGTGSSKSYDSLWWESSWTVYYFAETCQLSGRLVKHHVGDARMDNPWLGRWGQQTMSKNVWTLTHSMHMVAFPEMFDMNNIPLQSTPRKCVITKNTSALCVTWQLWHNFSH